MNQRTCGEWLLLSGGKMRRTAITCDSCGEMFDEEEVLKLGDFEEFITVDTTLGMNTLTLNRNGIDVEVFVKGNEYHFCTEHCLYDFIEIRINDAIEEESRII